MHETGFDGLIEDYLSGEKIEETTYEEFRQALARLLVEDRGYPRDRLRPRQAVSYKIEGREYSRTMDLVAYDEQDRPILVVLFCSGAVGSYERETVYAARLFPGGPVPLALVTDTIRASLLDAASGEVLASGMQAIPFWPELLARTRDFKRVPPTPEQRSKMERVFHAYSGFLYGACCSDSCKPGPE
ncbi:MAG: type I restriction enzyme HsdR N-terminal domain-containing protein [Desulfovibrionaceae bacterium]|nr:type I restriction enzyme HsdR N-terminal domain-containing protein [Desulfovibrionaceae bacterium]